MTRPAMPGTELRWDPELGPMERLYCKVFGAPIVGLRIRWRRLSRLLPPQADTILDAGCGRGVITRALARKYPSARIDAIDALEYLQSRNLRIAANAGLSNCNFEVADLIGFRRENHYDLIVSVDNLEHVQDDESVLENLSASLRPGGLLLVHVPHYYRRWPVLRWTVNFDVPGHMRPGYHLPELIERVNNAGFQIQESGFSYGFLENLANNVSYAITGAEEKNRALYALSFPILNTIAWLGQWSHPRFGAGAWLIARKP